MELGGLLDLNKEKVVILQDPDGHEVRFMILKKKVNKNIYFVLQVCYDKIGLKR